MTTVATRVENYRRLEKERQEILSKLKSDAAREDSFYRDQLERDLSANRDEVGYWRTCP